MSFNGNNYNYKYRSRAGYQANANGNRPVDDRLSGNYKQKDMVILSNTVCITTWLKRRFVCYQQGGVFYFGKGAVKMLENQVQFMLPDTAQQQTFNTFNNQKEYQSFSFGTVPHLYNENNTVALGTREALWVLYNFITTNVLPTTLVDKDSRRLYDMFENNENVEKFNSAFIPIYNEITANPFNPDNETKVVQCIAGLFTTGLLTIERWTTNYRTLLRSWDAPLIISQTIGNFTQQHIQQPANFTAFNSQQFTNSQQPLQRSAFQDDNDDDDENNN